MVAPRRAILVLGLVGALVVFSGFTSWRAVTDHPREGEAISRHINLLKFGKPQQKAAAAYWLGQQRSAAAPAVDHLVDLLGDASAVDPALYRSNPALNKPTLGEEAAAALVNIGHPSIEPLIHVLKTSPLAEARKNAAWALGALHDTGATTRI
jgi:PBS lyase HEAT-like repeat